MGDIGPQRRRYDVLAERDVTDGQFLRMPDPDPVPVPGPEPVPQPDPLPNPDPVPQPPSATAP